VSLSGLRRPSRGSRRPQLRSVHPRSRQAILQFSAAKSFPRPQGSDTIPKACGPAVQFNPLPPVGPFGTSKIHATRNPPGKGLFVREPVHFVGPRFVAGVLMIVLAMLWQWWTYRNPH
jgi:hypothetical protein